MEIKVNNMDYEKINYDCGKHLSLIVSTAKKTGYGHLKAIKEYTSSEYQFQDKINSQNGVKINFIISEEAKKLATEEIMNKILKMHVK